jgi:predicted metal-dependent enzyme (double-stranded beta helix superfamily)
LQEFLTFEGNCALSHRRNTFSWRKMCKNCASGAIYFACIGSENGEGIMQLDEMVKGSAALAELQQDFQALDELCRSAGAAYLTQAQRVLVSISAPKLLHAVALVRELKGYARTLIYGGQETSVWAFAWAPGCATTIHDHHCSCCYAVMEGQLTECWFCSVQPCKAAMISTHQRKAGFVAAMLPTQPNIHQMRNDTSQEAISLHIYGYEKSARSSSIEREYELVA